MHLAFLVLSILAHPAAAAVGGASCTLAILMLVVVQFDAGASWRFLYLIALLVRIQRDNPSVFWCSLVQDRDQ